MRRLDHRFWDLGASFDPPRDPAAYAAALAALHPEDACGIARLLPDIQRIYEAMYSTGEGRTGIPGRPENGDALVAFARNYPLAASWLHRSWAEFLATYLRTEAAKQRISALSGYITDRPGTLTVAQMVPLFGYALHGGFYPIGGSGRLAEALIGAIRLRGGRVHVGHQVLAIEAEGGRAGALRVRDAAGQEHHLPAAAVVLNGDPIAAARHLVPKHALTLPADAMRPACSAFSVHLGLRGSLDIPPVVHAKTSRGPVAIVAPSVVDPAAAPPGFSNLELLALLPQAEAAHWLPEAPRWPPALDDWRRTQAYRSAKTAFGDKLIARATEVIPDLTARIVLRTDASPVTFQRYAWTTQGSIYGIDSRLPVKQALPGLMLAGAATHGPGVEAVIISGALAAEALLPGLLHTAPAELLAAA